MTVARLAALMGILGLLLTIATGATLAWSEYTRLIETTRRETVSQAFFLADHASRLFEVSQIGLDATTAAANVLDWTQIGTSRAFFDQMHNLADALPYVEDIWLSDTTGALRATSFGFPAPVSNAADRDNFKAALRPGKELYIGSPITGRVTHRRTFMVSRRFEDAGHQFRGMIATTADIGYFTDLWRKLSMRFDARVTLFRTEDGAVLAQYPESRPIGRLDILPLVTAAPDEGSFEDARMPGRFGSYHRVAHLPVEIGIDKSDAAVMETFWSWVGGSLPLFLGALLGLSCLTAIALRQARIEARSTAALTKAHDDLLNEIKGREKAEAQMRQMQKVEAIGQLTGGLAHDFNNMMAIVIGNLGLLQKRLERGETNVGHYVAKAEDGAQRAAALTRRLLAFARRQPLAPESVEINAFVLGVSDMLRRTLTTAIKIDTMLGQDLWRAQVDPIQMENAILNIAINSRDAMADGGTLTIETANVVLDPNTSQPALAHLSGPFVTIAVTDTGTGMTPDVASRAFDPFFTTKDVGAGTGLGLSQVYGFVRQSGGEVTLRSQASQGTTITIYLPRDPGTTLFEGGSDRPRGAPKGSADETILVVEDEIAVRRVAVAALRDLGYTILDADCGAPALATLARTKDIKLLFTDIVMPGLSGRELAKQALSMRPDLKILFTTGFDRGTMDGGDESPVEKRRIDVLVKPYSIDELARRVRDMLDQA